MALLDDVKVALRVSTAAFDVEILDLITAARADLVLAGVDPLKVNNDSDPLIKRAITVYVKAHFGYDNPESERFAQSYAMLKAHLTLAGDYLAT